MPVWILMYITHWSITNEYSILGDDETRGKIYPCFAFLDPI